MAIGFARREFQQAPVGPHNAVCVDVIDRGMMANSYGGDPQPKIEIRWQLEKLITKGAAAGKPFLVRKLYTNSRHDKATVRKDLESWRGRSFTFEELKNWDFEKLIGQSCTLFIVHKVGQDGETRARVEAVLPRDKNAKRLTPDYKRAEPQHEATEPDDEEYSFSGAGEPGEGQDTDEEIPF